MRYKGIGHAPPPAGKVTFTSSAIRSSGTTTETEEATTFSDPSRPGLFYHFLNTDPPTFALSFVKTPPATADSASVIGWLPARTFGQEDEAGLNDFRENPRFREVLHEVIREGLIEGCDDIQINGALQIREGWMHIHALDERNPPPLGRIGDMDDIIGSVRVEDSRIIPDTYQPMPSYRICTADGVTQLTEGLATKLNRVLERMNQDEH
ncbi:hypothetical protein PUNSTDRAFT_72844 [Punctularia strigosozonata HHB-11173 SS5]|uniref:uncharacterized protein n=1 Tax=Punctularia strigosozonata (strain HHB-11173) TaxID=741275 RepID=UPI00044181B7|nr:uncharacterized protein PUNSTDRAFT_72844 [Punctularia strigosozonata HHB-11173 SS5]EIN06819.1 hypothetical protein PUNSTDRAFT_72844 [Punctularia strigosozonata HHB-11173 SS5]